jgi:hypothetical protein
MRVDLGFTLVWHLGILTPCGQWAIGSYLRSQHAASPSSNMNHGFNVPRSEYTGFNVSAGGL